MTELLKLTVAVVVLSGAAVFLEDRHFQEGSIYGADDCNGCGLNLLNPWISCNSPYGATNNSCDFNGCTSGNSCGNGTVYSGVWTFNYMQFPNPITLYSSTTSEFCSGKITCGRGAFNVALNCSPGSIQTGNRSRVGVKIF